MTAAALQFAKAGRLFGRTQPLPLWGWWALALGLIALRAWFTTGQGLSAYLGDMDDATRLVQVREFMAGAPWFNTTTMTMGGEHGMLSHWSRLIDLPIAAIITVLKPFMSVTSAELAARALWPMMVLAPLLWALLRTVTTSAGEQAGRIALALAILSPLGLYQFDVGRIDHHNAMIATTVSAALLMWAFPSSAKAWKLAGLLCGLALTVGYEALAPAVALAVFAALWGLFDARQAQMVQGFTAALILAITLGFLLTIPPSRWIDIRCDAISLNIVALSAIAGVALILALTLNRSASIWKRLAIAACGGAIAILVYAGLEPKCLAGPLGQLPPELKPIWLDYVAESRSIFSDLIHGRIEQSLGLIAFFSLGIAIQAYRLKQSRAPVDAFLLAALTAYSLFACWQYKYLSYASFPTIAPLACWIATLRGSAGVSSTAAQAMAAILLSQASLIGASGMLQKALAAPAVLSESVRVNAETCETNAAVRDLAELPPGLIAARIDLGAYIVALTHHRVLSAPYHRIPEAIIANHYIFSSRDAHDAATRIAKEKIDYFVTCQGLDDGFVNDPEWQGSLRADLVAGKPPAFLEPIGLSNPNTLFKVWRVDRSKLNLQP